MGNISFTFKKWGIKMGDERQVQLTELRNFILDSGIDFLSVIMMGSVLMGWDVAIPKNADNPDYINDRLQGVMVGKPEFIRKSLQQMNKDLEEYELLLGELYNKTMERLKEEIQKAKIPIHPNAHPMAGKTVKIKKEAEHFQDPDFGGSDLVVEDWWDRINEENKSWQDCGGNPACVVYAMRIGMNMGPSAPIQIPPDDEVVYGKTKNGLGHLVHINELDN